MIQRLARAIPFEASRSRKTKGSRRAAGPLIAMLVLGTTCLSAHADDCVSIGDGTGACMNTQVALIYVESGAGNPGGAYLKTVGAMTALPCTLDGGFVRLPASASNYKGTYATLLAAQLAQRTIDVRVSKDASAMCQIAYVIQH
jgi:hypothetical protein